MGSIPKVGPVNQSIIHSVTQTFWQKKADRQLYPLIIMIIIASATTIATTTTTIKACKYDNRLANLAHLHTI